MQTGIIIGHSTLLFFAVTILCFNWLYQRRVAKTQNATHNILPPPIRLLLTVSFFLSLAVVIILSGLLIHSLQ